MKRINGRRFDMKTKLLLLPALLISSISLTSCGGDTTYWNYIEIPNYVSSYDKVTLEFKGESGNRTYESENPTMVLAFIKTFESSKVSPWTIEKPLEFVDGVKCTFSNSTSEYYVCVNNHSQVYINEDGIYSEAPHYDSLLYFLTNNFESYKDYFTEVGGGETV